MGFRGASSVTSNSHFGTVPETFSYSNVQCKGSESTLQDCPHSTYDSCYGYEGAGVICQTDVSPAGLKCL
jgi:hypothetical protein